MISCWEYLENFRQMVDSSGGESMSVYKCEGCEAPLLVGERCEPCDVRRIAELEKLVQELAAELNKGRMEVARAEARQPLAYSFKVEW